MEDITPNLTFSFHLQIDTFDIPNPVNYPVFLIGMLVYLFSIICNLVILMLIITRKSLHKPMYYLLFSLPLNDMIGITAFLPRLLGDIVTQTNFVYYPTCLLQAFVLHVYGGATLFILAAMSIDRYFAICKPLQYHSVMTPFTLRFLICSAWGLDLLLMIFLFGLQAKANRCKTFIANVYCDNPALLKLSCGVDLSVNNIYGLFLTAFIQMISLVIQLYSYVNILVICIFNRQSDAKSKAVNTCLPQILIFVFFECMITFAILSYRFSDISPNTRKFCGSMIFMLPPVLNPIIYGMKTKELRTSFLAVIHKKKIDNT
ncbi:olfactory receptor 51I1-like [Osmerus eperlanus]|uniref:olfactory receptor 51I1-like n=1 Tax=Osmerus eperlanus TaxID=29151 RepID=UPI002E110C85